MTESLTLTPAKLYEKLRHISLGGNVCRYSLETCEKLVPTINEINQLKKEKNAIILAHSYLSPEIIYGVADFTGDSYELSKKAKQTSANIIVFAAVKFMAETAKLLNPNKTVLIPSKNNGCSLADSISANQVKELRKTHPDYTFICYINTTAAVKAACDICVTSSNVYDIIQKIPNPNIYFLPDKLMGQNIQTELQKRGVEKNLKFWDGTCYVHEEYNPDMIHYIRQKHPNVKVLSHPECAPNILTESDFSGSTSQMISYVKNTNAHAFLMLTECGLTSRLQLEDPSKTFVGSCTMCRYMKSNTLDDIKRVLISPTKEDTITIPENLQNPALQCIDKMFDILNQ